MKWKKKNPNKKDGWKRNVKKKKKEKIRQILTTLFRKIIFWFENNTIRNAMVPVGL